MTVDTIARILDTARTIAVVGCSPSRSRPSHRIAAYLQSVGYRVIPVNPGIERVLGEDARPDLLSLPEGVDVDIVNVFRRPEHVPEVVEQAIRIGAGVVWLQEGVTHRSAETRAREAGLEVVSDRCIMVEHRRRS